MEKRKVTVMIGGQSCSFYSDDPDEYITALAQRANAVMRDTSRFSEGSSYANAILSVVSLTDALMRAEREAVETAKERQPEAKRSKRNPEKASSGDIDQVSIWDICTDTHELPSA